MSEHTKLPSGTTVELSADFAAAKPEFDPLARAQLLGKLDSALFGRPQEAVTLGRFVILERLGAGGMGVVYKAYDPRLDRRVALKLVTNHPNRESEMARQRLLREAQSLARLSHPNVVPVHEVGILDDRVFIVMEFVVGHTLRAWLSEQPRSWRDIVAAYLQAGRGLAAAHERGLIHRDFKPDNAIIGDDRRVRVLDFGLARGQPSTDANQRPGDSPGAEPPQQPQTRRSRQPEQRAEAVGTAVTDPDIAGIEAMPAQATRTLPAPHASLTATNAVVGTPAYMAPEQFVCSRVSAKSDQFSFCLALYEALYGQRPYGGKNIAELSAAASAGQLREPPPGTRVPGWLYPILRRGLRPEPEQRFASMVELLAALAADPAQRRRRWLAALAVLAVVGTSIAVAGYSLTRPAAIAACADVGNEIAEVWNQDRRSAVERALLATGSDYAQNDVWPRVATGLDAYAAEWADMRTEACMSYQRGLQSDAMLDKRMACLDDRKNALRSAIAVLTTTDAASLPYAVNVVHKISSVDYCGNTEALAAQVEPPQDREVARQVETLRARLRLAIAQEHAGRLGQGAKLAQQVVAAAEPLGYKPLLAEALLVVGRIAMTIAEPGEAISWLHRATSVGLAAGMDNVALRAIARRVYVQGQNVVGQDPGQRDVAIELLVSVGESLSERIPDSGFGHALLLNNTGTTYLMRKDRERARQYFERALAVKEQAGSPALELSNILKNLASVTPEPEARQSLSARVLDEFERALGPLHPATLSKRTGLARTIASPRQARDILAPACAGYQNHPELFFVRASCVHYLAYLEAELGDRAGAGHRLQDLAQSQLQTDDLSPFAVSTYHYYVELAHGYALLYRGQPDPARARFARAIELQRAQSHNWWIEKRVVIAQLGLGLAELAMDRYQAAIPHLEAALAAFAKFLDRSYNTDHPRWLAQTRVALATALWHTAAGPGQVAQRTRARELVAQARDWYRDAGVGYEDRVRALTTWQP